MEEGPRFTYFTQLPLEVQWAVLRKDVFVCVEAVKTCKGFWENREELILGCDNESIVPDFITVPEIRRTFVQLKHNKGKISLKGPGKEHSLSILEDASPWGIGKGRLFHPDSQYWLILMMVHRFRQDEFVQVAINLCQHYSVKGVHNKWGKPIYRPNVPGLPEMPSPAQDMRWFLGSCATPLLGDVGTISEYQGAYNDKNHWDIELACVYGNITFITALIPDYGTLLSMVNSRQDPSNRWDEFNNLTKWAEELEVKSKSLAIASSPLCSWMFSGRASEVSTYILSTFATGMTQEMY